MERNESRDRINRMEFLSRQLHGAGLLARTFGQTRSRLTTTSKTKPVSSRDLESVLPSASDSLTWAICLHSQRFTFTVNERFTFRRTPSMNQCGHWWIDWIACGSSGAVTAVRTCFCTTELQTERQTWGVSPQVIVKAQPVTSHNCTAFSCRSLSIWNETQ